FGNFRFFLLLCKALSFLNRRTLFFTRELTGYRGGNPAARGEAADHFALPWLACSDKVIQEPVHHVLVENPLIPEAVQIKFQRLQFHAFLVWSVGEDNGAEVGLTSLGTNAGKFRTDDFHDIVATRILVRKSLQLLDRWFLVAHIVIVLSGS